MSSAALMGDAVALRGVKLDVLFVVAVLTNGNADPWTSGSFPGFVRGISRIQVHSTSTFTSRLH
jgi:hypothetical protein